MIRVCVAGAAGRMGKRILELAALRDDMEISGAFDLPQVAGTEITLYKKDSTPLRITLGADANSQVDCADVVIDFTNPSACVATASVFAAAGKPAVIGTTGLNSEQESQIRALAASVPIVFAPNMSVGVNLLFKLTEEVARRLGPDYNIEIVEIHHNQKKDSPSGTAVELGKRAATGLGLNYSESVIFGRCGLVGVRPSNQIGIHAVRGGDVIGEHTVAFYGPGERIDLTHKAHSRDNFARGALLAALFVVKVSAGLYSMQDVLGLT